MFVVLINVFVIGVDDVFVWYRDVVWCVDDLLFSDN